MPRPDNKPEKPAEKPEAKPAKPEKWVLDGDLLRLTGTQVFITRVPVTAAYDPRFQVTAPGHPAMPMQTLDDAKMVAEDLAEELKEFPLPAPPVV